MSSLREPNTPISIEELNSVVQCISEPTEEISSDEANSIIDDFLKREDAFEVSLDIIKSPEMSATTQYVALQALFNAVVQRWKVFEETTKSEIKDFLFQNIIQNNTANLEHGNIVKALQVLVQILVVEYPEEWPDFFESLLAVSTQSVWATKAGFMLLSLFAEEILDQTKNSVTSLRAHEMKLAVSETIPAVLECIVGVFEHCTDTSLIKIVLNALSHLVKFMDKEIIAVNPVICQQLPELMKNPELTIKSINVLTEIINSLNSSEAGDTILELFTCVISSLNDIIGDSFAEAPDVTQDPFFQVSFVTAIFVFMSNMSITELDESYIPLVQKSLQWVLELTNSNDQMVLETCVDFWLNAIQSAFLPQDMNGHPPIDIYLPYIEEIQNIISQKIYPPFTFTPILDNYDQRHIKIELTHNANQVTEKMRQCIVLLTHISMSSMEQLLSARISGLSEEVSANEVLSLCSVIGAVAGQMVEAQENDFFFETVRVMFALAQANSESDPVILNSIIQGMVFIFGQYSTCLQRFPPVLYEITKKMIEFLPESNEETQLAILDTFPLIINKCSMQLISEVVPETPSFLDYLIENFVAILDSICLDAKVSMFGVLLFMIQKLPDYSNQVKYFRPINEYLDSIWSELQPNINPEDTDMNSNLFLLLNYHSLIPKYLRTPYNEYLTGFVPVLVELYNAYLEAMSRVVGNDSLILSMKSVSSEIIVLFTRSVQHCYNQETTLNVIFTPAFIPLLEGFADSLLESRTPEILRLTTQLIVRLPETMKSVFPDIFHKLILPIMNEMIADTSAFPEFVTPFFELIVNVTTNNPTCIMTLGEEAPVFIDIIKFGCDCNSESVYTHCFESLVVFFSNFDNPVIAPFIYQNSLDMIKYGFNALTSLNKKAAFNNQVCLIRRLIRSQAAQENVEELLQFMCENYSSLGVQGIRDLFEDMLTNQGDPKSFRILMRNFLVNIRQISIDDPDLKKDERLETAEEIKNLYKTIPGFVPPDKEDNQSSIETLTSQVSAIKIN